MRLSKASKRYPIHQSPFFKLVGLGGLERLIGIELGHIDRLLHPGNYRVWVNDKGREIQQPIGQLGQVHKRVGRLLARVVVPDYVYSQKGRSYIDNARRHLGIVPLAKTDVSKFYPSTTRYMIWRLFAHDFKCANDVAYLLSDICCYQQEHLPTGSPLSGHLAYLAAREMFDEIDAFAKASQSRMTVYVDDVTLSGSAVTKRMIWDVRRIISRHGLETKRSKTVVYSANVPKTVTGAIVSGNVLKLPNSRHKRIWEARSEIGRAHPRERRKLLSSLRGREQEAKQILGTAVPT